MPHDEYVVVPEGWLSRGQTFVRGEGTQMVVAGGIPNERVRVRIMDRSPHQVKAKVMAIDGPPSRFRAEPPCDRYTPCGRCPLMHLNEDGRRMALEDILSAPFREAGINTPVEAAIQMGEQDSLHSIELIAGYSDQGSLRLGVTAADGREVLPIPQCKVVTPGLRELMKVLAHHLREQDIHAYTPGRGGTLKRIRAIEIPGTKEMQLLLVTARRNPQIKDLALAIGTALPALVAIWAHNEEDDPLAEDLWLVYGRSPLEWPVANLRLRVGPLDPFPAHPALAERMALDALANLAPLKGDAIVDAGAGIGLRTLIFARKAGWAYGVENAPVALARAKENATISQIPAEFVGGEVADALLSPRLHNLRPLLFIEASSKGIDPALFEAVVEASPRRIVVQSTNPRALARDLLRFAAEGYEIRRLMAYDVSPFTPFAAVAATLCSRDLRGPDRRAPRRKTIR